MRCKVQRCFWVWTTLLLLLPSTFASEKQKLVPKVQRRSHEAWLRLQRQQLPYVDDEELVNLTSLKLVQVLFRHGARTPVAQFPTDPNTNYDYGVKGPGQVTMEGKRQAFELGEYLRHRYGGYFEPNYSIDEVYAQSSNSDRTIMSTELCLAGLFAPKPPNPEIVTSGMECLVQLDAFPVWTAPAPIDNKIDTRNGWYCPRKEKLYKEAMNSSEVVKKFKENVWLQEFLMEKTGLEEIDFDNMASLGNSLQVQDLNGLPLPEWTTKVYPAKVQELLRVYFTVNTSTSELSRFQLGPLMAQFVQNIEMHLGGIKTLSRNWTPEDLTFYHFRVAKGYFFGGHDTTIASVLDALGLYDGEQPAYTSALILELHGPPNSTLEEDHIVKMFYKKERSKSIGELILPKCPNPYCTFAEFKKIYHKLILGDGQWKKDCGS